MPGQATVEAGLETTTVLGVSGNLGWLALSCLELPSARTGGLKQPVFAVHLSTQSSEDIVTQLSQLTLSLTEQQGYLTSVKDQTATG